MMGSLTIFGHTRIIPLEQNCELRTLLRLVNQSCGNLITDEYFLKSTLFIGRPAF